MNNKEHEDAIRNLLNINFIHILLDSIIVLSKKLALYKKSLCQKIYNLPEKLALFLFAKYYKNFFLYLF